MKGQFSARPPSAATIASSLLAMKVSAIQAIPNSAIIAIIPDLKIGALATSLAWTCARIRISAAAVSMNIWMIGVTDSGSTPPPSAGMVGRRPSKTPKTQIAATAVRKMATLRFAYGSSAISPAGAGGLISPEASRRWNSASSSRSLPCVFITSAMTKMPTMLAGIVISITSTMS